ncbi:Phosphoadenosine phosphosulfate reductase family-domain-containing protein [Lipomyces tetrasporus]|uniref:phosphoadenylyl-sulfate reductase (thioredoxin) n=1 Tax=Lipomyces tetrasporus TaxID=54092 RepID=A0AAD7QZH2_9ASCO|nr:Phosphoadenosine phosphosulfate reductase family-domain-containing protein [Lipomyces tetrasporus]KAJ8104323.1 Phosphoadenosine phosphosulfate reductase family-domain-containing protein [Lipomyces tetrasporus]
MAPVAVEQPAPVAQNVQQDTKITLTPSHLKFINSQLQNLEPQQILQWAILTFPRLFQSTAFGLTGLVTIDMISKLQPQYAVAHPIELIFVDTLHHFKETLELVDRLKERYPSAVLHVYKPENSDSVEDFNRLYGERLWETDEASYDFLVKVEPIQRAYEELGVRATLTGRRKSQGGKRGDLDIVEIEEYSGLIKINPLANWSFKEVHDYIKSNDVPYNALLDRGYRSVGDWHSTAPVGEGEDERAGRWKGKSKTECGIHETSKFAKFLAAKKSGQQELTA